MSSGLLTCLPPFSSVKGLDSVKKALECAATDDELTGVLIKGPTGTAKSVLVRSFVDMLEGKTIVNVPQNVTDEQLFGGLDIEGAIKFGRTAVKGGILQRADNNILYLDNVNLFDTKTLNSITECVESGKVIVEREGISSEYELRTTILATMDPAEQALPDGLADRFDICVQTYTADGESDRAEIILSNLEFESDLEGFVREHSPGNEAILERICGAREALGKVILTRSDIRTIAKICIDLGVRGHRADISVARVSRVLAALDGRTEVSAGDIKSAAIYCLLHRRPDVSKERPPTLQRRDDAEPADPEKKEEEPAGDEPVSPPEGTFEYEEEIVPEYVDHIPNPDESSEDAAGEGTIAEITGSVREELEDLDNTEAIRLRKLIGNAGKRKSITVNKRTGRYRGFRIPTGKTSDPAFDATVRAAAPYQRSRENKGLSINIEPQDIREKIRMKRDSCSFLFAVDVSGSLVKSGMMNDIKNGVKAMLMDSYVNRDKVALLTFRTGEVVISVPFTKSAAGLIDVLENTQCGDGTPLGPALIMIRQYMLNYTRKNPDERCYVIMITDGEATYPVQRGRDAAIELKKVTAIMNIPNTEWIVVDSSLVPGRIDYAAELAEMLNGKCIRLEDLQSV